MAQCHRSRGAIGSGRRASSDEGGGPVNQTIPAAADYIRILPEIVLSIFGLVIMAVDPFIDQDRDQKILGALGLAGTIVALISTWVMAQSPGFAFWNMVRVDGFSVFFHVLVIAIAIVLILTSYEYMAVQRLRVGEYYGLILFGLVGMCLMSSAVELVLIFIALEISSISTYILAGFRRRTAASSESSLKYFLLGSFATAFFLYGVALMFGATGTTDILKIQKALSGPNVGALAYTATALMIVGLGFKIASAPFHVWTPDVYEGAPAPVVALLSTGPKAAAFAVMLRVLFATVNTEWFWLIWISAALSMTLGNFGALIQNNVKRMLAYSSIAHAGYILVAFAAGNAFGIAAAIFYTAAYAAMNAGAFVVVSHFASTGERYVSLDDYAGLGKRSPLLAFTLTIFMLSLIGIPATAGFLAKYYVFTAALTSQTAHSSAMVWLTVIGLVNSAVASYYYLRLIVAMYMREPSLSEAEAPSPATPAMRLALVIAAIATIYLGVIPGRVWDYATRGAGDLTVSSVKAAQK